MAQNGKSARNLINKIFRRERFERTSVRPKYKGAALDTYDQTMKQPDVLDDSHKAESLMRKVVRRMERSFSHQIVAHKPFFDSRQKVSITRVVYAPSPTGHALQLTFVNANIIPFEGFLPFDNVVILNGVLKGKNLTVLSVPNSSHLLVTDVSTYVANESNITVRIQIHGEPRSYK